MADALYNTVTGKFNRAAIMRAAWEMYYQHHTGADAIRARGFMPNRLATMMRCAWSQAHAEKSAASRTAQEIANDNLAAQIQSLGCDTFRRAA